MSSKHTMNQVEFTDIDGNEHSGKAVFVLSPDGKDIAELELFDGQGNPVEAHGNELDGVINYILGRMKQDEPKTIPANERLRAVILASVGEDGKTVQAQDRLAINPDHMEKIQVTDIVSAYGCIAAASYAACFSTVRTCLGSELSPGERREVESGFWQAIEQSNLIQKDEISLYWKALENNQLREGPANKVMRALRAAKRVCEDGDNNRENFKALEAVMAEFEDSEL